uniref:LEM domain-containing protein n=1 Tax=Caenorhabditis japonica TaxID=281687 RepID=A0A8R1HXU0_CAEJA
MFMNTASDRPEKSIESAMVDVEKMSDAELRAELSVRGENVGPVTGTTRSLYEKKLKKLIASGVKTPARPAVTNSAKPTLKSTTKPTPKSATKVTAPAKPPVPKPKTPEPAHRGRPSINSTLNSSQNSTINRSEVEEYSDSDDDEEEVEEILSPKAKQTPGVRPPVGRPVSSTPTKKDLTSSRPIPIPGLNTNTTSSRTSTTINTTTRIPSTPKSVVVPNLITEFTPSFKTFGSDRPGATPPRNRGVLGGVGSSVYKSKVLADLGNTTGEDDDEDDYEGQESSRIIYNSKAPSSGIVKNAWNKVLGYGFNASKTPGESYDLRAGSSRISVLKNPKTGRVTVKQSNVFNDAIWVALYAILILFIVLVTAYVLTTSPEKSDLAGYWAALKAAGRDSLNFFYNYAILPVVSLGLVVVIGAGLFFGHRKYKEAKEEEEAKLFQLIERITELVKESAADGDPYVSQPHVRDVMFPPSKRRSAELARWEQAVKFVDQNESRIATDLVVLPSGNECTVWKWIGNPSNKRW